MPKPRGAAQSAASRPTGQYDHAISLILGGENRESNLQFLCVPCHKAKTKLDVKIKAKVARVRARHIGVKHRRRTIPGRKFDGTPIPARWVE
jgi:5-methylcytosine-specific restriction protein A